MGARGPKPKSKEIKDLEGNPGKRKGSATVDPDDVSSTGLRMPQRLTVPEREVWQDTVASVPKWWFRQADKFLLMAYCRAVVRWDKAEVALQNKSPVTTRSNGSKCVDPQIQIVNAALKQVMDLAEVLRLTPAKRKEVGPGGEPIPQGDRPDGGEQADEFGDLLAPGIEEQNV